MGALAPATEPKGPKDMSNDAPPPAGPPPAAPPPAGGGYVDNPVMNPADQRLWATLIHIGGIFFGFIPALIGYLVLKDRGEFIREHTKTALNFQITMLIAAVVGSFLILLIIGIFVVIAVSIVIIVFSIIAAIRANQGQLYRYPLTIPFIK